MTMDGVLRLYFGESNVPTPSYIVEAARRRRSATATPSTRRTPDCRHSGARSPRSIGASTTSSSIRSRRSSSRRPDSWRLHLAIRSAIDPGDEAIILSPAWPNGAAIVTLSHGVPVEVPLALAGERFEIDFDAVEAALTANAARRAHLALEPARLGRARRRAAAPARPLP